MEIGFLLNHEQIHQVPHSVPIAFELSRLRPDFSVIVIAASSEILDYAREIAKRFQGHSVSYVQISLTRGMRFAIRLIEGIAPITKAAMLRTNANYPDSFDALVVPDKTALMFRTRFGASNPKLIHTRHGAGDRSVKCIISLDSFIYLSSEAEVVSDASTD